MHYLADLSSVNLRLDPLEQLLLAPHQHIPRGLSAWGNIKTIESQRATINTLVHTVSVHTDTVLDYTPDKLITLKVLPTLSIRYI